MSHFNVAIAVLIGLGVVVVGSLILCSVMLVTTRHQSATDRRLAAVESGLSVQGHLSSHALSGPAPRHPPPRVNNMAAPDAYGPAPAPYRQAEPEHRFRPQLPSEFLFARSLLYPSTSPSPSVPFQGCLPIPPSYDPNRRRLPSYEDVMGVSSPAAVVVTSETVVTTRRRSAVALVTENRNEVTTTRRTTTVEHAGDPSRTSGELSTDDYGHATDDDTASVKSADARPPGVDDDDDDEDPIDELIRRGAPTRIHLGSRNWL